MKWKFVLILFGALLGWQACQSTGERGQPQDAGSSAGTNISEQGGTTTTVEPARVPSEAQADSLLQLQQQIMQQPENMALRRELGSRAIDTSAGVVWAVGKGRVNPRASNPSVAASQAELAAVIDASRWAAYLMEWQKTDYATNFGTLQASVPGATVVRKSINDSLCVVLVRVPLKPE
ncbi:MAG: hypothetical protein ONB44_06895 [candidate division KSB1 bacterium]|nr:hypothetical protein [candidate division KSB1 bacterium]MDZ7301851.1 hypothetical protein [candidate division KSB1 bacterium]MDZ7310234.1 hypothetical protein [candidate division KSB1 bacterium]